MLIVHWFNRSRSLLVATALCGTLLLYVLLANFYCIRGEMNADEGYFLIASRVVFSGFVPYRDFAYTQMPLLPYVNGALMKVVGYSFMTQRAINATWGGLALLTIFCVLRMRLRRWEPALLATFILSVSPNFVAMQAIGKSYALPGFFLALSFLAIYGRGSVTLRAVLFALFGSLAIGCRLNLALVYAISSVVLLPEAWRERRTASVALVICVVPLLMLAPFFLMAPEQFKFFNWDYHLASSFDRRSQSQWIEWWQMSPAALLIGFSGLSGAITLVARRRFLTLSLLIATLIGGCLAPMCLRSAYGDYLVPVLPVLVASGLIAIADTTSADVFAQRRVVWLWAGLPLLCPLPALNAGGAKSGPIESVEEAFDPFCWLRRPCIRWPRAGEHVHAVSSYIRKNVPSASVLTPLPIVAVESGLPAWPGTELGQFSVYSDTDPGRARKLHLVTLSELVNLVAHRVPKVLVMLDGQNIWNFEWVVPSLKQNSAVLRSAFYRSVSENYTIVYRSGNLDVLLPKRENGQR